MQVTIVARRPDDELLLLASDGLWDVLSNQEAVTLAKRCLRRARQRGASRQSAARIAGAYNMHVVDFSGHALGPSCSCRTCDCFPCLLVMRPGSRRFLACGL